MLRARRRVLWERWLTANTKTARRVGAAHRAQAGGRRLRLLWSKGAGAGRAGGGPARLPRPVVVREVREQWRRRGAFPDCPRQFDRAPGRVLPRAAGDTPGSGRAHPAPRRGVPRGGARGRGRAGRLL